MAFFKHEGNTDRLDPRIAFWTKPDEWPDDSPTHLLLARAVLYVGELLYGDAWTGKEPQVELLTPLSDQLHASTSKGEVLYGCRLLYEGDAGYRGRCPEFVEYFDNWPIPTPDEWTTAVEVSLRRAEESRLQFRRFMDVCFRLQDAFKNGLIDTATRGHDGGIETPEHRALWYTEYFLGRFYTCQVDPSQPYNQAFVTHGDYIFVERDSLIAATTPRNTTSSTDNTPSFEPPKYLSSYLRCMIDATVGLGITEGDARKKEEIMQSIPQYWPGRSDELTDEDIKRMATFMREPQHKKGRAKKLS